jgi:hypothetical protein
MVFVSEAVLLDISFDAGRTGLKQLITDGALLTASHAAYDEGVLGGRERARAGPPRPAPMKSRLVRVRFREPVPHGNSVVLTLRWEAAGDGDGLFPALDADITITPVAARATLLRVEGSYRAPSGAPGSAPDPTILYRIATTTIRAFLGHLGDVITGPGPIVEAEPGGGGLAPPSWPPEPGDI